MKHDKLIECVPNFSEGRNPAIIKAITDAITSVNGVKLLDVDPGKATNRTVVTFVGHPDAVIEAAFNAISVAASHIDMRNHQGEHARMGATDVCPLIPITNVSEAEAVAYAHTLAQKVAEELKIPVYLYEQAATQAARVNLANIRAGEYEGLATKLQDPNWKPDYGDAVFNPKAGATVIGVRGFLAAFNINLNTQSTRIANAIAFDVREQGRIKRTGHPVLGEPVLDANGEPVRIPGTLKSVKAVGWYIDEFKTAQISMNLTNLAVTPLHIAFDEVCRAAQARGVRVTGSELVGLIPLQSMLDAGKYFLTKQGRSVGVSATELIDVAVRTMGLNELYPFDAQKKIIEYMLKEPIHNKLINLSLSDFADETASEAPAPGGGSIAAYVGSLGAALAAMVANLSASKRGWEEHTPHFSYIADKAQRLKAALLQKVDEDTRAFDSIMQCFGMPKNTPQEKAARKIALRNATRNAIEIPKATAQIAMETFDLLEDMIKRGNPNSISDAGVGVLCARAAVEGAFMNVKINCKGFDDHAYVNDVMHTMNQYLDRAKTRQEILLNQVYKQMDA